MWRAILLFWLSAALLGLSCVAKAETIPAPTRTHSYWYVSGGLCVSDDAVSNSPPCKLNSASAMCSYLGGGVQEAKSDIVFCDNGRTGFPQKDTYRGPCPPGYETELYGTQCYRPDQPKPDPDPATCTSAQLANYCSMVAGQVVDTARFNVGTRSRVCDNYYPKIPGCNIQEDAGCRITRNYPQVTQFKYNGQACAQVADGDPNNQSGTSPSSCAPGEYYGTVNNVTGCFGGGPVPPSDKPSTDPATGKDANGNCSAGYVGRIKNNALECIPAHEPSDGKSCPPGWNAVGIGGKTVCVDPTSGPGGGSGGTGGNTGGGTGGTPGGGGTGGNTGGGTGGTPGKPDASSPSGEKPGECDYTGMWKFLCSDKPGAPDTSAPNLVNEGGVNLTSLLNTNDIFTRPAACPANLRIDLGEGSVELQYTLVCSFAEKARPGVIIACVVVAAFIIFRRG